MVRQPLPIPAVRLARYEDASQISAILLHYAPLVVTEQNSPLAQKIFAGSTVDGVRARLSDARYVFLCAERESQITGIISLCDNCTIVHFFVRDGFRGQRIGSALWQHARQLSRSKGNDVAINVKSTLEAEPIYRHLGFEAAGEPQAQDGVHFVPMRFRFQKLDRSDV